jgi:hypothetical protein
MSQENQLTYLQQLLDNLPESIPYRDIQSTNYNFSVSINEIKEYGDKTSATNHRLEINFGSRHDTNGIVPITERGPGICAVVPILFGCSLANACIELWVHDLCSSAEKLYAKTGKNVRVAHFESDQLTHESQLPETPAHHRVLETGKKRKFPAPTEVIDVDAHGTEEGEPVSVEYFRADYH